MNSSYCMYWKSIWCNANGEAVIQPSWWHVIAAFAQNKRKKKIQGCINKCFGHLEVAGQAVNMLPYQHQAILLFAT